MFSGSVLAHPVMKQQMIAASKTMNLRFFTDISEKDLVPFHDFPSLLLPFRENVGNAAIWLNGGDLDLADQLTLTIHKQLGVFKDSLVPANIKNHKIVLRIDRDDRPASPRRQHHFRLLLPG